MTSRSEQHNLGEDFILKHKKDCNGGIHYDDVVLYCDEYYRLIYESMKLFPFLFATRNPTSSPSYPCDLGHRTVKALLVPGSSKTTVLLRLFTVSIQGRPSCHDKNSIEMTRLASSFEFVMDQSKPKSHCSDVCFSL